MTNSLMKVEHYYTSEGFIPPTRSQVSLFHQKADNILLSYVRSHRSLHNSS